MTRDSAGRRVGVWLHPTRPEAADAAAEFATGCHDYGVTCRFAPQRLAEMRDRVPGVPVEALGDPAPGAVELLVVFGGDGSILSAAEWALPAAVPLLGVNLGHVGFLAELESSEMPVLVRQVAAGDYRVERRLTLRVDVADATGAPLWSSFAVNELSIEKTAREMMVDLMVAVDGRPLSHWACDGLLVATPSGSTAYALSAGGPVVWPDVEAIEMVPLLAHALFARPLVLSPASRIEVELTSDPSILSVVWCDGRRSVDMSRGCVATITRNGDDLRLARLSEQPFTTRLVKKFQLPVNGFRTH
ncbi:MAG: NAD kinase [Actinomycetia bacterium]|nr:NAD kinase [Actinomycetes bacterium]